MKEYIIRPLARWEDMEKLEIAERMWTPTVDIAASAKIGYTKDALLVRLEAREALIRAEESGPLGHPWEDSCLEFFLSPVEGDPRYINIEFNPNACCCLGLRRRQGAHAPAAGKELAGTGSFHHPGGLGDHLPRALRPSEHAVPRLYCRPRHGHPG